MLDEALRPVKERVLLPAARAIGTRVQPLTVTLLGFACGIGAAGAAAAGAYGLAVWLWLANRILDGLDGTLARAQGTQTDMGGYVDILLDFVVYAAIPIGLLIAAPSVLLSVATASLLGSFYVNAASWMYLSAVLERRGEGAVSRNEFTTVMMPEGLVGGSETVVAFTLFLALPGRAVPLFAAMSVLVLLTVVQRVVWAARNLPKQRPARR